MASIMETLEETLLEEIDKGIDESLPQLDPVVSQTFKSSLGVVREGIGRTWKAKHLFSGSLSGGFEWSQDLLGDTVVMDGSNEGDGTTVYGSGTGWPGLTEMAGPGIIQSTVTLKGARGNFPIPWTILESDELPASLGSIMAEIVRGSSKRVGLANVHSFWKLNPQNGIAKFAASAASGVIDTTLRTDTLTGGRIRGLYPGMLIDIFPDSGGNPDLTTTTAGNYSSVTTTLVPVIVTKVNGLQKKFTYRAVSTAGTVSVTQAATYHVRPKNSAQTPEGLVDWIKATPATNDGTKVLNINLFLYPQFSSIKDLTFSGVPSSDEFNRTLGAFGDAYGAELDTILWTTGTMLAFLQNVETTAQLVRYNVQGTPLKVKAGFQPFGYVYEGTELAVMTSPNCPVGNIFIVKLGDKNIRKYVPPTVPQTGRKSEFSKYQVGEIEFVAPRFGSSSIFWPFISTTTGGPLDKMGAPFIDRCQYAPKKPQGIHIGTFDENIYG